ncbi:MAG: hypothetical protein ACN6I6_00930 [bacterium]
MNIDQRLEFENIVNYFTDNQTRVHLDKLKSLSSVGRGDFTEKGLRSIDAIKDFLDLLHRLEIPSLYLKKTLSHSTLNVNDFNESIERYVRNGDRDNFLLAIDNISYMMHKLTDYRKFLECFDTSNLMKEVKQSIVFSFGLGRAIYYSESLNQMTNGQELFKLLNTLLGSDDKFEVIHVEDGSLKMFVATTVIVIQLIDPLSDIIAKNVSKTMDLIHKNDLQQIEKEIREEKLKHLKSMNGKDEDLKDIEIDEELLKLKKKQYEMELKYLEAEYDLELTYQIRLLCDRYSSEFKHDDNPMLLLKKISEKIERHFRSGGFISTYSLRDSTKSSNEKNYKEKLNNLTNEQLKYLENSPLRKG